LLPGDTAHNVPSTATAITGVLSVHASTAAGFVSITVDPTNLPTTSTINFPKGDNRSTGVTVPLNNDGTLSMTYGAVANNSVQVTLDVTGYFAPVTGGASYRALTTNRILDSRPGKTNTGFLGPLASGTAKSFTVINRVLSDTSQNVPATAVAVTGVLTVTGQTKAGFVTIGPDNLNAPPTSTVWVPVGDIRATGITVKLGSGGALWVTYTSSSTPGTTHVIFDVTGCFVPGSSGAMYVPVTPKRIVDSRPTGSGHTRTGLPGSLKAYRGVTFQVTGLPYIPPTATAVTGSLTVVNQTAAGFLSLTKTAVNVPTTSNMNFPKGDVRATGVTAPLGPGGIMGVTYGASPSTMITDVLFDVTGYFVP
jgi:hypothetical protein